MRAAERRSGANRSAHIRSVFFSGIRCLLNGAPLNAASTESYITEPRHVPVLRNRNSVATELESECVCVCWGSEGRTGEGCAVVCLSSHALTQLIITLCTSGRRSLISSALLKREITACPCFWQQSLQPHITEELIGWRRPIYHPSPPSYWSTLISLIWRNNIFQHFLNLIDDHDFFLWLTFTHSFSCFCSKFVASFVVVLSLSDLTFILVEW